MDIKQKIRELAASTAKNSITPESLGAILMAMYEATLEVDTKLSQSIQEVSLSSQEAKNQISSIDTSFREASQQISTLSKKMESTQLNIGDVKTNIQDLQTNVRDVTSNIKDVKSSLQDVKTNVVNVQTTVEEIQSNPKPPTNEQTIIIADEQGKLTQKTVSAVWRGTNEAYVQLLRAGLRDPNTAYIITE